MKKKLENVLSVESWLRACDGWVALAFTDIVESTLLLHALETVDFSRLLRAHRRQAAELVSNRNGRILDESGDGLFAAFPNAIRAWSFAHQLLLDPGAPKVRIRAGLHVGPVTALDDGLVGRNVHLAARVMQHAGDQELWLSDAAKKAVEAEADDHLLPISWITSEVCSLRGFKGAHLLWRAA